jgi:D-beta-D-heptose 7-phosphate kinase/D-beta-D-heptose 1-phosphate adenosyltransferase
MQRERAARLLTELKGRTALVVGDLIFDSFVYGGVERISREAPVPILSEKSRTAMLGGAGNLARNTASLGGKVRLVSVIGQDAEGAAAAVLAKEACGDDARLVQTSSRVTPSKIRYVSNNQQMFCVDRDPQTGLDQKTEDAVMAQVETCLAGVDVVILSDYGRGVLQPDLIRRIIDAARKAGIPVSVDPRGADFTRYDGATVIKPNADELALETGLSVGSGQEVEAALTALMTRLSNTNAVLVTRGGAGMCLLDDQGRFHHHRSRQRAVFDVSGAGDTALAALSLGLAARLELPDAMALADMAAGVAVGKPGTAVVTVEEILEDAAVGADAPDWRVLSQTAAAALCRQWSDDGLKVGFTNGCFDILHPGHLAVLRHAASVCDRLVVGLNSDASVKRLKGDARPVNDVVTRAVMLASLEMVDRVVVFEEDTPQALIEALVPDVLIKGADYVADDLPGAAL